MQTCTKWRTQGTKPIFFKGCTNVPWSSQTISYPTIASVPHSVANGVATVPAAAAAPAVAAKEESEEEVDDDMGFGLFD